MMHETDSRDPDRVLYVLEDSLQRISVSTDGTCMLRDSFNRYRSSTAIRPKDRRWSLQIYDVGLGVVDGGTSLSRHLRTLCGILREWSTHLDDIEGNALCVHQFELAWLLGFRILA